MVLERLGERRLFFHRFRWGDESEGREEEGGFRNVGTDLIS